MTLNPNIRGEFFFFFSFLLGSRGGGAILIPGVRVGADAGERSSRKQADGSSARPGDEHARREFPGACVRFVWQLD